MQKKVYEEKNRIYGDDAYDHPCGDYVYYLSLLNLGGVDPELSPEKFKYSILTNSMVQVEFSHGVHSKVQLQCTENNCKINDIFRNEISLKDQLTQCHLH